MSTNVPTEQQASASLNEEGVEGLQEPGDGLSDYPLNELLIRPDTRTIQGVLKRISDGWYIMDPDFQRAFVWEDDKQSALIESVMMRIPLPVFYLAENPEGKMVVVDGLQRLSTFRDFRNNKLKLNLPENNELHGKRFDDLAPKHQNRFEDCNLICYILDSRVPDRARLDIFKRVNGGVALSRQQMRNALYSGPATRFLRDESQSKIFLQVTDGGLNWRTMRDREFVNRFCSFQLLGVAAYPGDDMDEFLAAGLKKMNDMQAADLERLSKAFRQSLANNHEVFGFHAFRKSIAGGTEKRTMLNASLWDVMTTALAPYNPRVIAVHKAELKRAVINLLRNEDFSNAISFGTGGTKQVLARFEISAATFKEVLPC